MYSTVPFVYIRPGSHTPVLVNLALDSQRRCHTPRTLALFPDGTSVYPATTVDGLVGRARARPGRESARENLRHRAQGEEETPERSVAEHGAFLLSLVSLSRGGCRIPPLPGPPFPQSPERANPRNAAGDGGGGKKESGNTKSTSPACRTYVFFFFFFSEQPCLVLQCILD